jgi:hypothetical protein
VRSVSKNVYCPSRGVGMEHLNISSVCCVASGVAGALLPPLVIQDRGQLPSSDGGLRTEGLYGSR